MNFNTTPSPFQVLLSDAAARFGVTPADLAHYLAGEICFTKDHPFNSTLTVYVADHVIQLTPGENAGCVTCTRQAETQPGSRAKLVTCPASAAACVRFIINRKWDKYGADFETWRAGDPGNSEDLPAPLSTLKQAALDLQAEYPKAAAWIERGLALAEAGVTSFPQYNTRYSPETRHGHRECDCPARAPHAKFGRLCKHIACQEIIARAASEGRAVAYRELVSDLERERSRVGAL